MVGTDVGTAVRRPGAWGPFEAAVQAIVAQECNDLGEARRQLDLMVRQFGPRVPGLTHGLTHLFPSAEVLAAGDLTDLDLPPATIKSLAALTAGVTSGEIVLDHGVRWADLVASLTGVTGIEPATAHQIALRLGHREPTRGKPGRRRARQCRR
jgi:AraC family transcriptional regulator of adaptative response / DNA-3-methyladenine glycosylase II